MAIPEKIPTCSNYRVKACPRSDVVVSHEDDRSVAFFCRTCQGLQVFTRDEFSKAVRARRQPIIVPEPKRYF